MSDDYFRRDDGGVNPYAPSYSYKNSEQPKEEFASEETARETSEESVKSAKHDRAEYGDAATDINEMVESNIGAEALTEAEAPCSREWYDGDRETASREIGKAGTVGNLYYSSPYEGRESRERTRKSRTGRTSTIALLIICMVLSTVFGGGSAFAVNLLMNWNNSDRSKTDGLTISQVNNSTSGSVQSEGTSTADIVEKIENSVVEITTEYVKTGVFSQQYITSGGGSGVVVDKNGYIVTNHHVVESAKSIRITMHSGENYDAILVGSDEKADVALLKVEAELEPVVFGNSDKLRVGDKTIAIGNPLGQLGGTVTEGIISALDRELSVDGQKMTLLQTDSAINPGNSGGGLFDASGNLIGVVCAKSSGSEIDGLGFAIPINTVIDVMSDLMEYGYVRGRVNLGIEFLDINSTAIAWMYGLDDIGCYVYDTGSGSNAEKAGIRSGDRVISVNGITINTASDIEEIVGSFAVGDTVKFNIVRSGRMMEISFKLEEYVPADASTENGGDFVRWNDRYGN